MAASLQFRGMKAFACLVLPSILALEGIERLLYERSTLPDAAVDLLRQNFEALVTDADCLLLSLWRNRRRHRQLISSV